MGLRKSLDDLFLLEEASKGFADAGTAFSQAQAGSQLRDQAAGLLQSGQLGELASLAFGAGDPSLFRTLIEQQAKAQFPTTTAKPLGLEQATQLGTALLGRNPTQTELASAVGLPQEEARQTLSAIASRESARESGARQENAEARRQRTDLIKVRANVVKDFDKELSELAKEEKAHKAVKAAFERGKVPDDAILFNFIARNVAGEKGPLSDSDVSRIQARVFGNDAQKMANFFTGQSTSMLSTEQRKAFNDIIKDATAKFGEFKQERLQTRLGDALVAAPELLSRGEKFDQALSSRAEREGFKILRDGETLRVVPKDKDIKSPKDLKSLETPAQLKGMDQITDPALKSEVAKAIKGMSIENAQKVIQNALRIQGQQ